MWIKRRYSRSIGTDVGEDASEGIACLLSDPSVQLGAREYPRRRERNEEDEEFRKVERHCGCGAGEQSESVEALRLPS